MSEKVRIHSRVDRGLLTRTLMRGSVAAGLGMAIILAAGVELPVDLMASWGILILAVGILLIAGGLIPYRVLAKRRDTPDELAVGETALFYAQQGKRTLTIPFEAMNRLSHIHEGSLYGVLIDLKPHPTKRVKVHTHDYDVAKAQKRARRRFNADIFLPFFPDAAYSELRRALAVAGYTDEG